LSRRQGEKLRFEDAPRERDVVGADRVHANRGEVRHQGGVIDRPGNHPCGGGVRRLYERFVNEGPLAPEVAPADGAEGVEVIDGVAHLKDASRDIWRQPLRLGHLAVVKGVDRAADARLADGGKGSRGGAGPFELAIGCEASGGEQGEGGVERRWGLCIPRQNRVVVDPEDAVRVEMDVELHAVRPELCGTLEGREGVLGALAGGPAVGD
jgi:hypothetical protein